MLTTKSSTFEMNTRNTRWLRPPRGSNIAGIDRALRDYWERPAGGLDSELDALQQIVKECMAWLKFKHWKPGKNILGHVNELFHRRRLHITALGNEALGEIGTLLSQNGRLEGEKFSMYSFDKHKLAAYSKPQADRRPLKPMCPSYQMERKTYLQSGKTYAVSGSGVHTTYETTEKALNGVDYGEDSRPSRKVANIVRKKDINKLTADDYRALGKYGSKNLMGGKVNYFTREEREAYIAIVEQGDLVDRSHQPITTAQGVLYAYAMDRFGNVFYKDASVIGDAYSFNHSSLNAGQDVVCAGTFEVERGSLRRIDNNSGHYKPTRTNMWNCLDVLATEGLDLRFTVVNLYVMTNKTKEEHNYTAQRFHESMHSPPDLGIRS